MDYIHSKVEEILYQYVGLERPIKKEKTNGALVIETDLLPTDLEQVSPDSDMKSEVKDEEVEEEIVEDEDFESPAFEPIEPITAEKNENSNLSAISGLTSQSSLDNKNVETVPQESQLSQISSIQDMSQEPTNQVEPTDLEPTSLEPTDLEPPKPIDETEPLPPPEPEKSQFDLKKDTIEFSGTERNSITIDETTTSGEAEKIILPQDVPSTMEIDNLYENCTTDSSEMRMEIDLKEETTESSKIEESSQDSKDSKQRKDSHRSHHPHKSSRKSSRHHHSSRSRSHYDDKNKSSKSGSSSHKKTSSDKDRSSSSRREHDKKSESRSKNKDDHHQEKSTSHRRRSTDHDSNEGKLEPRRNGGSAETSIALPTAVQVTQPTEEKTEAMDDKPDNVLTEHSDASIDSKTSKKSSILVKYDYLKSPPKPPSQQVAEIEDGFVGFTTEKLPANPWFDYLAAIKKPSNSSLEPKFPKTKAKSRARATDSPGKSIKQLMKMI